MKLQRVNKKNPCTACGHDSWCLLGETAALCMRVESERPYTMKDGSTGWWHSFDRERPRKWVPKERKEPPKIDAVAMMTKWNKEKGSAAFIPLAKELGVDGQALADLRCRYANEHKAWAFPMRDGLGKIVGIRLRGMNGRKWAVSGSRQGIFLPYRNPENRVYICEGPTDCAALLTIHLYAIGRPSCSGGSLELKQTIQRLGIQELVIVADNDNDKLTPDGRKYNPGMDGAKSLIRQIPVKACIITMPTKDIRDFVKCGGTAADVEDLTKDVIWENCSNTTAGTCPAPRASA